MSGGDDWVSNPANNFDYFGPKGSTGTLQSTGQLSPTDTIDDARLNPYEDPGPWGRLILGGLIVQGVIVDVDGAEKPEEWAVQKGTAAKGATTVWRGTKLAEDIKITIAAPDRDSFDGLYDLRDIVRPKLGQKPPSLLITNPVINFNGIILVSLKNLGQPKWSDKNGSWTILLTLQEYNPSKPVKAGPADSAKPGGQPTANDAADREIQDLMKEVNAL